MSEMSGQMAAKEIGFVLKRVKDMTDFIRTVENPNVFIGRTPDHIDDRCLTLCRQYLAGNWLRQTLDTIQVSRIAGGWINQLYYVAIKEPDTNEAVPQEVTIRLEVGVTSHAFDNKTLKDMIIVMVFADKGLGPKVYGVLDKGIIQQYCKTEHDNPKIVDKVFRKLAHIHNIDVPISKDPDWQFRWIERAMKKVSDKYDKEVEEYKCEELMDFSFEDEIKWLKAKSKEVGSPVMFTHNDYRSANIMITEPNDELVVCDFDFSSYGYRGADFVMLPREYRDIELTNLDKFPVSDSAMAPLVAIYADECGEIHGQSWSDDNTNSVEHIINEIKFFWCLWLLCWAANTIGADASDGSAEASMPRNVAMEFGNFCVKSYKKNKQMLIDNKIITP